MISLFEHFGERLVKLHTGADGLRGSLICDVREPAGAPNSDSAQDAVLDFVASDGSLDRYDEVVSVNGWQLDHYRKNPVVVDSHDYSSVAKILGCSEEISVCDGQLVNRVRFALDNPLGALAFKMARAGFIRSESVGFQPLEWVYGGKGEPYRTYQRQELLEISLVAVPANPAATIGLALKSGAVVRGDVLAVADQLRTLCSDMAAPEIDTRALDAGGHDARLLQFARDLEHLSSRA